MLKVKQVYIAILVGLFSYLFGFGAIDKYLARKTLITVTKTKVKADDIPSPALLITPGWKMNIDPLSTGLCGLDLGLEIWECLENVTFAYTLEDLVSNATGTWKQSLSKPALGIMHLLTSTFTMTTKMDDCFRKYLYKGFFWFTILNDFSRLNSH